MNHTNFPDHGDGAFDNALSVNEISELSDLWSERDILAEAEELGHVGAWAWHVATGHLWWTDETYRILGLRPQEFPADYDTFLQYVHPDDRDHFQSSVQAALAGEQNYDIEHRIIRPDGEVRTVHERGKVVRSETGTPVRMLGLVRDITEERDLQQERDIAQHLLAQSEERHRLLAENAWDVVWTMGIDGSITYVSPSVERVRGLTPAEAMVQTLDEIHPAESAATVRRYFEDVYQAMADGTTPEAFRGELEYYRKDGSIMHGELQVIPHVDVDGSIVQLLGVTRDISERRRFEQKLNRLAVTDPLTNVWNRRQGAKLINGDINEARRYGPSLALLMLDIDHFKRINDTYGHQTGDHVLIELTQVLMANMRSSDVLIRWGGEEFVILTRHCGLTESTGLAMKLRSVVESHAFETVGTVTVSIGVAELHPGDDLDSWLARADVAMYQAKESGRNCVKVSQAGDHPPLHQEAL
jgi:diguanylate cyclase (GGDEF)-like protein/PAS domain S-box-containing protein